MAAVKKATAPNALAILVRRYSNRHRLGERELETVTVVAVATALVSPADV